MLLTWFYLFSAEAARKNFDAERGLAREIVQDLGEVPEDQEIDPHTLSDEEVEHIEEEDFCSIPKKPLYDFDDTPETFQQKEIDSFWKWKRTLSRLQAKNPKVTIMTKLCPSKFTLRKISQVKKSFQYHYHHRFYNLYMIFPCET